MLSELRYSIAIVLVSGSACFSQDFESTSSPSGWEVTLGKGAEGDLLTPDRDRGPLILKSLNSRSVPVEATFRCRADDGLRATFSATGANPKAAVLAAGIWLKGTSSAYLTAQTDGQPMATLAKSTRTWSIREKKRGGVMYQWRFSKVRNIWEERDRREIGSSLEALTPFDQKEFTIRLVLSASSRQVWVDHLLVAEERVDSPPEVGFSIRIDQGAVLSATFKTPGKSSRFTTLNLSTYPWRTGIDATAVLPSEVPMHSIDSAADIDLGQSLFRYRLSHGTGPDTSYLRGVAAWPDAFKIDPAEHNFRVPYRVYQNVWLLVWLDDDPHAVPKGTFRFYRQQAGFPAATDFEISRTAIRKGLVKPLKATTSDGRQLYLVRVPVNTDAFYGFRNMSDQFLEFQLSKPVQLIRGYGDPIYYGEHPSGPTSSIHVVAMTLEESTFDFEVEPKKFGHIFEQPEIPEYAIEVSSMSTETKSARVRVTTRSHDGEVRMRETARAEVGDIEKASVLIQLDTDKLGWHELKIEVEVDGVTRTSTQSFVLLPPNQRTYGYSPEELRFGAWVLYGHYTFLGVDRAANEPVLAMLRRLGIRRIGFHGSFIDPDVARKHDFLPRGGHTVVSVYHRLDETDPKAMQDMVAAELKAYELMSPEARRYATYFYGGEWGLSKELFYAPPPLYTGEGLRQFTEQETKRLTRQTRIFTAIGKAFREKFPEVKLILQWGGPQGTVGFLRHGFPKDLVDGYGMDAPYFELVPESPDGVVSLRMLWTLRREVERLGWPQLPLHWCEGPFLPTNPGALTERQQSDHQVRYFLNALSYGVENFEAGIVPQDAGNYYGAEHYGAGLFHRLPTNHPKPAVAAVATATSMLCGATIAGAVDTGRLDTYCMEFKKGAEYIYALWRVVGSIEARIQIDKDTDCTQTDSMGATTPLRRAGDDVRLTVTPSPVWLKSTAPVRSFQFEEPEYSSKPVGRTLELPPMTAEHWYQDKSPDTSYERNHFAKPRATDPRLRVTFGAGERGYRHAAAVTLPVQDSNRPLLLRYSSIRARTAVELPGKPSAVGVWIKGNGSWGRIAYRVRDAAGEMWTSIGSKDDWNCDDTHGWSYIHFEGWRYVRFPLPGSKPYDAARELDTTWWKSEGGDGIVDYPLEFERVFVEARNEVPRLGLTKLIPNRTYKLSGLVAEYEDVEKSKSSVLEVYARRKPLPDWEGPKDNPIARLRETGIGHAPAIREVVEPHHFADGRRMIVRFGEQEGKAYNLYLSLYEDGRGAELLRAKVKNDQLVYGFKPETKVFLFLTSIDKDKKESKPSTAYALVTHDNFAEK